MVSSCAYVDTTFGRAPQGSAMDVQLSPLAPEYAALVSLERRHATPPAPLPCLMLFKGEPQWMPPPNVDHLLTLKDITLSEAAARNLERDTRQQSNIPLCQKARENRLTAPRFFTVLSRKQPWTDTALQNVLRPKSSTSLAVRYGISNEGKAVARYTDAMQCLGYNVTMQNCGLMVRRSSPWLGATPDRVVCDAREQASYGLLEVKCPWTERSCSLEEALKDPKFYIQVADGKPRLKETSNY